MGAISNEVFLGTATAYLALKDQGFFDGVNQAQSALQNFSGSVDTGMSSMEKLSLSTGKIGMSLTRNVTTPVVAAGKSIIDAFRSTEDAFIGVQKTLDTTAMVKSFKLLNDSEAELAKGYDILNKAIWDMTQETGSSYETIASVMEMAGQLNVGLGENGQGIIDFTKNIIMLNDTTDLMGADAAKILAQLTHLLGTSEKEFGKLGATIVDLGNNTATTEADIVSMSQRLAGAGSTIGLTEPEILALAATLTSVGISAEMGGSAFSKAMKKMQVAAETGYEPIIQLQEQTGMSLRELELLSENDSKSFTDLAQSLGMTKTELKNMIKSGVQLQNFADIAGMSAEEFATTWKSKPIDAIERFIVGLSNTEDQGKSTIQMLQDMGFTEVRLSDVLSRMALTQDDFTENLTRANKAWDDGNALEAEAEKRYAGLNAQLSQLNEEWKLFRVELAEFVIPILKEMMGVAREVIGFLRGLPDPVKEAVVQFAAWAALLGPILLGISRITEVVVNLGKVFGPVFNLIKNNGGPIMTAIKNIPGIISKVSGSFGSIVSVIGGVIQKLSGIGLVIGGAITAVKNFFDMWKNGWDGLKTILEAIGIALAAIGAVILGAPAAIAAVVAAVVFVLSQLAIVIHDNWDAIKRWGHETWESLKEGWQNFKDWFAGLWDGIVEFFKGIGQSISDVFGNAIDWIKEKWNGFKEWWQGLGDNISEIWSNLWDGIFDFLYGILDKIHTAFNKWIYDTFGMEGVMGGIPRLISDVVGTVLTFLKGALDFVTTLFKTLFNVLIDLFTGNFDKLKQDLLTLWNSIKYWFYDVKFMVEEVFIDIFNIAKDFFGNIISSVSEFFSNIWSNITEWFSNLISGISDFFSNLKNNVVEKFEQLRDAIHNAFEMVKEVVLRVIENIKEAFNTFLDFIKNALEGIKEAISNVIEFLKEFVSNAIDAIKEFFQKAVDVVKDLWEKVSTFVKDIFTKIGDFVKDAFSKLWDWIKEFPGKFFEIGKLILSNLWDGLKEVWKPVSEWFEEKFGWISDIIDRIKSAFGGITDSISNAFNGSHANGLDYVPFDGYVAQLHKGERVLTKSENEEYTNGYNNVGGDTFNFYNTQPDPYEYARQMKRAKKELLYT